MGRSIDGQRAEPEGESADLVFPADHSRSGRQDRSDVAQGLVGGGEQTMSRAWRHILNGQGAGVSASMLGTFLASVIVRPAST